MTTSQQKTSSLPKWVRYRAAAYLRGKGLSYGVPSLVDGPLFPVLAHEGSAFNIAMNNPPPQRSVVTGADLSLFARESCDHILLQNFKININYLADKLKAGGHFIQIGDGNVVGPKGHWEIKEHIFIEDIRVRILKKLAGKQDKYEDAKPRVTRPRALIARYGAIGDALQLTPMIHQLHDEGYSVTLNVSPYTTDIYKHNPYVSNIIIQERNVIPNHDLGEYWAYWAKEYDRYINLSESIEGKLLKVEGRSDLYTTKEWRHSTCDVNYHDQHMALGGLTEPKYHLPEMYFSRAEEKEVAHELQTLKDNFVIAWSLKGSSHHKLYAFLPEVAASWLGNHPDSYIVLMGGPESVGLQLNHDRIIPLAGQWPLRKSILLTKYADLVIGPESAIINAASCFDTPKIALLSHSTPTNLTKYWTNTINLAPNQETTPCYPCHQLHYSLESCPLVNLDIDGRQMKDLPRCTTGIGPSEMYAAIDEVYQRWLAR